MSQTVVIVSTTTGEELGTTDVESVGSSAYMNWVSRDMKSLLYEIDGLSTIVACDMIEEYLEDTIWLGCVPRSINQMKYFQMTRQTIMNLYDLCITHRGIVCST